MSTGPSIDYTKLQQEAMRGVVRSVLQRVVKTGLPGEHHFYISFLTQSPGVILSKRLKEKYPTEMTIVLQHRFWDLIVSDERFEVKLTFDGIPERLVVPFAAVKVFIDPSVRYGLQFDDEATERDRELSAPRHTLTADAAYDSVGEANSDAPRTTPKKVRPARKARTDKDGSSSVRSLMSASPSEPQPPTPEPATRAGENAKTDDDEGSDKRVPGNDGAAKVVSLDQFRKK